MLSRCVKHGWPRPPKGASGSRRRREGQGLTRTSDQASSGVVSTEQSLAREQKLFSKNLYIWGKEEQRDLADTSDRLAFLIVCPWDFPSMKRKLTAFLSSSRALNWRKRTPRGSPSPAPLSRTSSACGTPQTPRPDADLSSIYSETLRTASSQNEPDAKRSRPDSPC